MNDSLNPKTLDIVFDYNYSVVIRTDVNVNSDVKVYLDHHDVTCSLYSIPFEYLNGVEKINHIKSRISELVPEQHHISIACLIASCY